MIRTLRVRNLATIEELELDLGPGLHILTGETGAGKSVLLAALALLRGGRVSSELVRTGADEGSVEAVLCGEELLDRAREAGLAGDGDEELLITRTIARTGRGRVHVNGALATAAVLERLLENRIQLVSQGEHQQILRPEVQARLLDDAAGSETQVGAVAKLHAECVAHQREIQELRSGAEERVRREDRLRFEIDQIRAVDPQPGELEALTSERGRLVHVERLAADTAAALGALVGDDGARDRVAATRARLAQAATLDPALEEGLGPLERAEIELGEAVALLEQYEARLELDPARLQAVEARLEELHRLQERYGSTVDEILEYRRGGEAELERLGGGEAGLERLEGELEERTGELRRMAEALTERRRKGAAELTAAVEGELRPLGLRTASFEVRLVPVRLETQEGLELPSGPRGSERAEFWLAPNPGEEPRRLRDAASGGERARVVLALRTALRAAGPGQTLLFDEIDVGIGGRTARRVGERLRRVSQDHQVVCITHLPQIAALGDTHARIVKKVHRGRTHTLVEPLDGEGRVEEIARIAGGGKITPATRAHARDLLGV